MAETSLLGKEQDEQKDHLKREVGQAMRGTGAEVMRHGGRGGGGFKTAFYVFI